MNYVSKKILQLPVFMVLYLQEENQKMQIYFKKKDETAIFGPIFAKKNSPKKKHTLLLSSHGRPSRSSIN